MTWGNPPKFIPTKPKQGKKITPEDLAASGSEDGHQAALFCWAADNCGQYPQLKWLFAIPNGGSRHIVEAIKMVGAGTRSGVWDVFLPCNYKYHGCFIEMKEPKRRNHKDGGLSIEQIAFGQYVESEGYYCAVCYSWEEARDVLINYLEGRL
jgi:hypothetical protein